MQAIARNATHRSRREQRVTAMFTLDTAKQLDPKDFEKSGQTPTDDNDDDNDD